MAEPAEKPILDRLNDTFKEGLNVSYFLKSMRRNLQADVNRKLREVRGTAFTDGSQLPDYAQVSINEETMNLYVNGFLGGPGNRPIPIAHVSLHLAPSGKTNVEGALHGKSNTNEGDFVRYFLQKTEEGDKLVKPVDEEWDFPIRAKYMTMKREAELFFVQLVFDILNTYLPDFFERPAAPAPAPAPSPAPAAEQIAEHIPRAAGVAAAAVARPEPERRPLTAQEQIVVDAINEFFSHYNHGINNTIYIFDEEPFNFLAPESISADNLSRSINNLNNYMEDNSLWILRFEKSVRVLSTHATSPALTRKLRRFEFVIRYLRDSNEYYESLIELYNKVTNIIENFKNKTKTKDLLYLLWYVQYEGTERMEPTAQIPPELIERAYSSFLPFKQQIAREIASINKYLFPSWMGDYIIVFLQFEIRIQNYLFTKNKELPTYVADFVRLRKLEKEFQGDIEKTGAFLQKLQTEIQSQEGKKLSPKQKAAFSDDKRILERETERHAALQTKLGKLQIQMDIISEKIRNSQMEAEQYKREYTEFLESLRAFQEIKNTYFARFNYPPDFESIDEQVGSMSGGGSRRNRRSTRRGRRAAGKRKTRGH